MFLPQNFQQAHLQGIANRIEAQLQQAAQQEAALQVTIADLQTNGGKTTLANAQTQLTNLQAVLKQTIAQEVSLAGGVGPLFGVITTPAIQQQIQALLPTPPAAAPATAVTATIIASPAAAASPSAPLATGIA